MKENDLNRCRQSSSLIIYPSILESQNSYLQLGCCLEFKKILMQLKLINANCTRIIAKGRVYKISGQIDCEFCNINHTNIFHSLFECELFKNKRKELKKKEI